jgi:hypothetical protein
MSTSFGDTEFRNDGRAIGNRLVVFRGPIELNWHHCSVTSEFLGEFYGLRRRATSHDYNEARHSIGYLANELLENALKFGTAGDILVESSLDGNRFEMKVTNLINAETASRFQATLATILARDPGELLIERIEQNAADPSAGGSGLGLLTLMSDYGARLGWTFHDADGDVPVQLETYAALDLP